MIEEYPQFYHYKAGLASTYLYRGELLLALGQPEPATAELTKSLAVLCELLDRHGVLTKSMLIRGNTFLCLGRASAAADKKDEAAAHWKNAAKVFELALRTTQTTSTTAGVLPKQNGFQRQSQNESAVRFGLGISFSCGQCCNVFNWLAGKILAGTSSP